MSTNIDNKTTALMVSIPQREINLKEIIETIYPQVDEMRLVLNDYKTIPNFLKEFKRLKVYVNTPDKLSSNAIWIAMDNISGFVFTCDDDILYPSDYVSKMKQKLQWFKNQAIISVYGETVKRPYKSYRKGRSLISYRKKQEMDKFVDIMGVGCSVFHTKSIYPQTKDFPDLHSRDMWFAILAHKHKLPIIRIASPEQWLKDKRATNSPEIRCMWKHTKELADRREYVFRNILLPLLSKEPRKISK